MLAADEIAKHRAEIERLIAKHDDLNTAITRMQIRAEKAEEERDSLRALVSAIHVAIGEDSASDDETLPDGIRLHLEGHVEISGRLKQAEGERDDLVRAARRVSATARVPTRDDEVKAHLAARDELEKVLKTYEERS